MSRIVGGWSLAFLGFLFASAADAVAQAPAAAATKPLRVHIIGASVSGGFRDGPLFGAKEQGDTVTMHQMLKAWCGEAARVTTHSPAHMTGMFTDPDTIGEAQIAAVLKAKPDIVVAIDFPFWFAYGAVRGPDEATFRREKLARGLALMARFEGILLIGDLPDMTGAAPRMLSPSWIPKPPVLKELNTQLAEWVKAHPKVQQVALGELVGQMRAKGASLPLQAGALQAGPAVLLQEDRLHANRLGMAFLGLQLQTALHGLFPEGHALRAQQWTIEQFVAACGAEGDLEAARAAATKSVEPAKQTGPVKVGR